MGTKKLNGKVFKKAASFVTLSEAKKIAAQRRKNGYYVRLIPRYERRGFGLVSDTDYDVYIVKKIRSKKR